MAASQAGGDFLSRLENTERRRRMQIDEARQRFYGPEAVMGDPYFSQKQLHAGLQRIRVRYWRVLLCKRPEHLYCVVRVLFHGEAGKDSLRHTSNKSRLFPRFWLQAYMDIRHGAAPELSDDTYESELLDILESYEIGSEGGDKWEKKKRRLERLRVRARARFGTSSVFESFRRRAVLSGFIHTKQGK